MAISLYMWAYIMTETSSLTNFNFGFSTHKSDILIHLSQWQYWWWFWFSLLWGLYFYIITRVTTRRTLKFNAVINTSIRGHGKWGDFVVAVIPLSWCMNILINSNFILRMIEWQNETSLFTLRVQGKQWYWVYKFDATAAANILAAPKNVGNNRWAVFTPNESYVADSYYQAVHLGAQLEYKELYLKYIKEEKDLILAHLTKHNTQTSSIALNESFIPSTEAPILEDTYSVNSSILEQAQTRPLTFVCGLLNKHNLEVLNSDSTLDKPLLFNLKCYNKISVSNKTEDSAPLWGYRQKKYKRLKKYLFTDKLSYDPITFAPIKRAQANPLQLKSTLITSLSDEKAGTFNYQQAIVYARQRSELVPVNLARRLLRTKRTLVLPAHVNITVVTNSYDVVHSWFIPGLGIKMDCVPGRSTHHTFYVDNVGFYYGQCAEICGRYHHHMPIRICALPFEQFFVWWQHKGLKRLHRIQLIKNPQNKLQTENLQFRYTW